MNKIKKIFIYIFIFLSLLLIFSSQWLLKNFGNIEFEQYLYHLLVPMDGANTDVFFQYFQESFFPCFLVFISLIVLFKIIFKNFFSTFFYKQYLSKYKVVKKIDDFSRIFTNHFFPFSFLFFFFSAFFVSNEIGLIGYVKSQLNQNRIYDDYYVEPSSSVITFSSDKRNLILIYLESLENTYSSFENGGAMEEDLIPELSSLASENISFSNTDKLGGALPIAGTGWTIAAMVSTSSGVQLHSLIDYDSTEQVSYFMPNLTTLGDILEEQGYHQVLMLGSDSKFGNRYNYYVNHGGYEIFDYHTAVENGDIPDDYYVWWGYEDAKLFDFAKRELMELSQSGSPFNLTLLTVDTHFVGGYLDPSCDSPYNDNFKNVLLCSSSMVGEFVSWIQKQEFYEDTTIVIIGDHLTMDNNWITKNVSEDYVRTIYNVFINSALEANNTVNRTFTSFDLFPTILASMGVSIDGDRLGLGTNLFSNRLTLSEELGFNYLHSELLKKSKYYDDHFVYSSTK